VAKRFISFAVCLLVVLQCLSCTPLNTNDVLTNGANRFGQGKTEQDYHLDTSGKLLAELIDKYADSYYHPTVSEMTEDEFEDLFGVVGGDVSEDTSEEISKETSEKLPEDTSEDLPEDTSETVSNDNTVMVSSISDLERVFYTAYKNTDISLEFEVANSFDFQMEYLELVYQNLQNQDPINASGVESWSVYFYGNTVYVQNFYFFDVDELKKIKKETYQLVADAAKEINVYGEDDCTIVCSVNDYLCESTYYPDAHSYEPQYDPITHTAYGCLEDGCAVCEGYACATKLLLNEFGVESLIEIGDCFEGGGHAWNLVKVEGNWYQLDVTWNDCSGTDDYLLVTDDYMKQTRVWDYDRYPGSSGSPYQTGR